jgi:hypothetical protein
LLWPAPELKAVLNAIFKRSRAPTRSTDKKLGGESNSGRAPKRSSQSLMQSRESSHRSGRASSVISSKATCSPGIRGHPSGRQFPVWAFSFRIQSPPLARWAVVSAAGEANGPGRAFQCGQPRCRITLLQDPKARFQCSARRFQRRAATPSSLPRWRLERQGLP